MSDLWSNLGATEGPDMAKVGHFQIKPHNPWQSVGRTVNASVAEDSDDYLVDWEEEKSKRTIRDTPYDPEGQPGYGKKEDEPTKWLEASRKAAGLYRFTIDRTDNTGPGAWGTLGVQDWLPGVSESDLLAHGIEEVEGYEYFWVEVEMDDARAKEIYDSNPSIGMSRKASRKTAANCACAHNTDGTTTTMLCPVHGDEDPCAVKASVTGRRRKGSIVNGVCTNCGWSSKKESSRKVAGFSVGDRVEIQFESGAWDWGYVTGIDGDVIDYELDDGYQGSTRVDGDPRPIRLASSIHTAMPAPEDYGVKVGDIFYSEWGYDQTNIDFYEVVRLTPAGMKVRPVANKFVDRQGPYGDKVVPDKGNYTGPEMTKRLQISTWRGQPEPYFNINSYSSASLWDGTPKHQTDSLYGH